MKRKKITRISEENGIYRIWKDTASVSRMCLGTWGIGGAGWDSYSDESRMDAIKAAVD